MFGWFERKPEPKPPAVAASPAAPHAPTGGPHHVRISYANGDRTWTEEFNLLAVFARVLQKHGYDVASDGQQLEDRQYGFVMRPKMEAFQPTDAGGAQSTTTIRISHPMLTPDGVFEYQHSTGNTAEESVASGFDQWVRVDYLVFVEALHDKPAELMVMTMSFPAEGDTPERHRRILLGPVAHFRQSKLPPRQPAADGSEEHDFCPCCLLTRSFEAFKSQLNSDEFFALRLFAMRDKESTPAADCRVNGEEFEQGKAALRQYVESWPHAGIEFRKQYVIIHSIPAPTPAPGQPASN